MDEPVTLYVSGLPSYFNEENLRTVFSEFGTVVSCICEDPRPGKIYKYGFVKYSTFAEAENCLSLYKTIPDLNLEVRFSKENTKLKNVSVSMSSNINLRNKSSTMPNKTEFASNSEPHMEFREKLDTFSPNSANFNDSLRKSIELPDDIQCNPSVTGKIVELNPNSGLISISFNNTQAIPPNVTLYCCGNCKSINYFEENCPTTQLIDEANNQYVGNSSTPVYWSMNARDTRILDTPRISHSVAAKSNISSRRTSIKEIIDKPLRKPYALTLNKPSTDFFVAESSTELLSEIIESLPKQNLEVGDQVAFSFGNSPCDFYVRKVKENKKLISIVEQLNLNSVPNKGFKPTVNCICSAKHDDGSFYRARVEKVLSNNQCLLHFVDFGNSEIVQLSNLSSISDELKLFPPMAYCLRLLNIKPMNSLREFSTQSREKFCDIINSGIFVVKKVTSFVDDKFTVQLEDTEGNNLSERLVKEKIADPVAKYLMETPQKALRSENSRRPMSRDRLNRKDSQSPVNFPNAKPKIQDEFKQNSNKQTSKELELPVIVPNEKTIDKSNVINVRDQVEQSVSEKSSVPAIKLAAQNLTVGDEVVYVYGNDPYCFFLQKFSDVTELEYISTQLESTKIEQCLDSLEVGSLCAAKYSDELWYRARIQLITNGQFHVFFLDYGNSEVVSSSEISSLMQDLCFSAKAYRCRLSKIKPVSGQKEFSQVAKEKFAILLTENFFIVQEVTQKEEIFEVELVPKDKIGTTLSEMLFQMKLVELVLLDQPESISQHSDISKQDASQVLQSFPTNSIASPENVISKHLAFSLLPKQTLQPGEKVTICFGDDPRQFYTQKTSSQEDLKFITDTLQSQIINSQKIVNPQVGHLCSAKFEDGSWYRAKIAKDLGDGKVEIYFLDFGNVEIYKLADLVNLPQMVVKFPPLAYLLTLNVKPLGQEKEFPIEIKEKFVGLIADTPLIVKHSFESEESFVVVLEDEEGNDISQLLVACQLAEAVENYQVTLIESSTSDNLTSQDSKIFEKTIIKPVENVQKPTAANEVEKQDPSNGALKKVSEVLDNLPDQKLCIGDKISLIYDNDPCHFFVQKHSELEDLKYITSVLQTEMEKKQNISFAPKLGLLCSAKYIDSAWYRARIQKDLGNGNFEVFFLDFGNSENLSSSLLNFLPPDLYRFPEMAYCLKLKVCPLNNEAQFSSEVKESFFTLINEFPLIVIDVVKDVDSFLVELKDEEENNIAGLLVSSNLAQSMSDSTIAKLVKPPISVPEIPIKPIESISDPPQVPSRKETTSLNDESLKLEDFHDKQSSLDRKTTQNSDIFNISIALPVMPLQTGAEEAVCITHVDEFNFYIQRKSDISNIEKLMINMQNFCSKTSSIEDLPKVGDLLSGRFTDGVWYRVHVISVKDSTDIEVLFLDFGNRDKVSMKDLKPFPKPALQISPFAYSVCFKGTPNYNEELKNLLMTEEWDMKVVAAVCSTLPKTAVVELKSKSELVNKILRSKII